MATGYIPPRYEDIRASVVARWKLKFGANANTASDQDDGLIIDIITLFVQSTYDGLAEEYNQHNIGTATGLSIDAIIAPLFRITRLAATPTTSEAWLYGTAGTVIPAFSAVSTVDTGASFETTDLVTIAAGARAVFVFGPLTVPTTVNVTIGADTTTLTTEGTSAQVAADIVAALFANPNVITAQAAGAEPDGDTIVFVVMTASWSFSTDFGDAWDVTVGFVQATETGPTVANYGTITRIGAPATGWEGLTNLVDATLGTREETDSAYKARHAAAVFGRGNATPRGLAQRLLALTGVAEVKVYQNTSGFEVAGRPSHSFEAVVDGGSQTDIAETIWLTHTTGTQSTGSTLVTVIDEQGLVAQPNLIRFSRPNYRYIHAQVNITRGEGFPLLPLTDLQALVSSALETWGNTLDIGRDVYVFEVGAKVGSLIPGIASIVIYLASTSTPGGSPAFGLLDLTMAELDYSRWAANRIGVQIL